MNAHPDMHLVEAGGIPEYPISADERLDSHFFIQWNLKRWRASETRRRGYQDPACGFYALELFFLAQDEAPVGTLPADDDAIAFLLRMTLDRWKELKSRAASPLAGWYQVQCDNGQVRLAHKVVTEIALEALTSKQRNTAKNADDRMRKRLGTIAGHLKNSLNCKHIASNEAALNDISDWIEAKYPGGSATLKRVKEAFEAISMRGSGRA